MSDPLSPNMQYRSHPWHGMSVGENAPGIVNCYIEMVPTDTVKYELDKSTGILKVDRPQQFSSLCPTLYGFIPQTYCGTAVADYCMEKTGRSNIMGDKDPLDICVLTEKVIPRGDIMLRALPIGGLRLLDGDEADDKIIAVLKGDFIYEHYRNVSELSENIIERLRHYFLTYKDSPDRVNRKIQITHTYDVLEAYQIIKLAQQDYKKLFSA